MSARSTKASWGNPRALCLLLALLVAGGCSEDVADPCGPTTPAGRIQGRVQIGWEPVAATLRVTRVAESWPEQGEIETEVAPDGTFLLDVASGRYIVQLRFDGSSGWYRYRAAGLSYENPPPDTLLVDPTHTPVSINFDLASVRVRFHVSTQLDGGNALVRLHRDDGGMIQSIRTSSLPVITNGELAVVVPGVLQGKYRAQIAIDVPGYSTGTEWVWIPGGRDSADSPWIDVSTGRIRDVEARVDAAPASIRGQVIGAWQTLGLQNAPSVGLVTPDSVEVMSATYLGSDGTFDLKVVFPTPVKVYVQHQGIVQWIGGRDFDEATVYELEPGRTVSGVQFVESGLRVDVESPDLDVQGARFNFYDAATRELRSQWNSYYYYGPGPGYGVPNLLPGNYLLEIVADQQGDRPWVPQWFDGVQSAVEATPITIAAAGDVGRITVAFERGGTISGTMEGSGLVGYYRAYVTPAEAPTLWGSTILSAGHPSFTLQGLPDGDWKVGVWSIDPWNEVPAQPPPGMTWYPGTGSWADAGIVAIRNHEDVTGVTITVPPGTKATGHP